MESISLHLPELIGFMMMNWSKGKIKFFTRNLALAQKAACEGNVVTVVKLKSNIYHADLLPQ